MDRHSGEMNSNKGFTLIELMVAVSIFLVLVSLSTAIFIQTLRTQRMIMYITADNESASEALEQISRDVRTGYNFTTPDINSQGVAKTLMFISTQASSTPVAYKLIGDTVARCIGTCQSDSSYEAITPPDVAITDLSFIPENLTSGVPRITIVLAATTPSSTQPQINTYLETTVSARNF